MGKDKKINSIKNNTIVVIDKNSTLQEEVTILKEQAELLKKEIYNLQLLQGRNFSRSGKYNK